MILGACSPLHSFKACISILSDIGSPLSMILDGHHERTANLTHDSFFLVLGLAWVCSGEDMDGSVG